MKMIQQIHTTSKLNVQKYREWYRNFHKSFFYHPVLHLGANLSFLLVCMLLNFYWVKEWTLETFITIPIVFLFGNVTVWVVHRYPLHRRFKFWSYPYDTHTVGHHRYFTMDSITFDSIDDFVAIFFPQHVIIGFALVVEPIFYFSLKYFLNESIAHAFCACSAAYFLMYEFFHLCGHLKATHPLMKIGWIRYMRRHHMIHHHTRFMRSYNFCIVYPMMDILMGTIYKGELPKESVDDHYQDVLANSK